MYFGLVRSTPSPLLLFQRQRMDFSHTISSHLTKNHPAERAGVVMRAFQGSLPRPMPVSRRLVRDHLLSVHCLWGFPNKTKISLYGVHCARQTESLKCFRSLEILLQTPLRGETLKSEDKFLDPKTIIQVIKFLPRLPHRWPRDLCSRGKRIWLWNIYWISFCFRGSHPATGLASRRVGPRRSRVLCNCFHQAVAMRWWCIVSH